MGSRAGLRSSSRNGQLGTTLQEKTKIPTGFRLLSLSAYNLNTRRDHVIGLALFACLPPSIAHPLMIDCGGLNENRKEVILTKEVLQEGKMDAGQPQAYKCEL